MIPKHLTFLAGKQLYELLNAQDGQDRPLQGNDEEVVKKALQLSAINSAVTFDQT